MKTFKLLAVVFSIFCAACGGGSSGSGSYPSTSGDGGGGGYVTTTTTAPAAANTTVSRVSDIATAESGLDLQAVAALAKKARNAEDFERLLNQPDGVNNLDLDEDGKVDYINITEFKNGTQNAKGYSLSVDLGESNIQEIATLLLERDNPGDKTIAVYVAGIEEVYGTDDYYAGEWNYSDAPFAAWSFGSRPYYSSSYRYGYYPSYYSPFAVVGLGSYRSKMQSYRGASSAFKSVASVLTKTKLTSPNAGKVAANIKAPLSKPTAAQQSFQKTNPSRTVASTGSSRNSPTYGSSSTRSTSSPSYSSSRSSSSPSSSSSSSSSRSSSSRSSSTSSRKR